RMAHMAGARRLPRESCPPSPRRRFSHRLTHAADAPRHGAHDVAREVRHLCLATPSHAFDRGDSMPKVRSRVLAYLDQSAMMPGRALARRPGRQEPLTAEGRSWL